MAKGKEDGMKKQLRNAIETLGKISGQEEVSASRILKSAFENLELKLRREFMELEMSRPGKREVKSS